ncbi:MAG: aldehyde dehydrogenase family protein, partial [Steroidobacterales bacterium]
MSFRLTYSTMFDPPAALHELFEAALGRVRGQLGKSHGHYIDGALRPAAVTREKRSPINRDWVLGRFGEATDEEVNAAVAAARRAQPAWRRTPPADRCRLLRRV